MSARSFKPHKVSNKTKPATKISSVSSLPSNKDEIVKSVKGCKLYEEYKILKPAKALIIR